MFKKLHSKFVTCNNNKKSSAYTVKNGDNLWDISVKLGISLKDIIDANPSIKNPDLIYIGQVIYIPVTSIELENHSANIEHTSRNLIEANTYTVKSGDNLWDISVKIGVSHKDLIDANPLITNPNMIYAGQIINIP